MAFQIKLNINDHEKVFVRNGEPNLRDVTNALKVQQQQIRMFARKDGPTNDDHDENENNLANFAVDFWKNQFSKEEVIDGATRSLKSLQSINVAIQETLKDDDSEENGDPKKSPKKISKKPSKTSASSTKVNLKKDTSLKKLMN